MLVLPMMALASRWFEASWATLLEDSPYICLPAGVSPMMALASSKTWQSTVSLKGTQPEVIRAIWRPGNALQRSPR